MTNTQLHRPSLATLPTVHVRMGANRSTVGCGGEFVHVNPATGSAQATVPLSGPDEVDAAIAAARAALPQWVSCGPTARRDVLIKLANLLHDHNEEFATITALEAGIPISKGRLLARNIREWAMYTAGWADKLEGRVYPSLAGAGAFTHAQPEPYGVVGVIFPWNNPMASVGMKVFAPLVGGNTVVIKPSEFAPFAVELFARLADEAGVLEGVINVVPGTGDAGSHLSSSSSVDKISFTGGPATGRKIMAACAGNLTPSIMELGGKSANLVFDDADLSAAASYIAFGSMVNLAGQACVMGSRVLIQERVFDEVLERVAALSSTVVAGDPLDDATQLGPVISAAAQMRILGMISGAGGRVITGGGPIGGDLSAGFFVQPTAIADPKPSAAICREEVFGPVVTFHKFKEEREAVAMANDTKFGLAAFLQTNDLGRVHRLSNSLRSGGVFVNGARPVGPNFPFGGIGESGFGREGSRAGIDEFLRFKTVSVAV